MTPRIVFDLKKYAHNLQVVKAKFQTWGISYTLVSKVFLAFPEVTRVAEPIVDHFGDSRVANLKKMAHLSKPKMLIRLPMPSEAAEVVRYANISLNSELHTVKRLNEEAAKQDKTHQIVLMKDLGDLREGYFYDEELFQDVAEMVTFKNIEIVGIGANLCCFGGIMATPENLTQLVQLSEKLSNTFGLNMQIVSGGASTSMYLMDRGTMPPGINNLRSGDCAITGNAFNFDYDYPDMVQDVLVLEAEIIEVKRKPSVPVGITGMDAFSGAPHFTDRGVTLRAIAAIGRQDVDHTQLRPHDPNIQVLGASSDHLIMDINACTTPYQVGDVVTFRMGYSAILRTCTSPYVEKVFLH